MKEAGERVGWIPADKHAALRSCPCAGAEAGRGPPGSGIGKGTSSEVGGGSGSRTVERYEAGKIVFSRPTLGEKI